MSEIETRQSNRVYTISEIIRHVEEGINVNTLLIMACRTGNVGLVKITIELGAYVDTNNGDPILWSIILNHFDIFKYLVENGADITINNNSPLHWACLYGQLHIVKYLVENGGIDIKNIISRAIEGAVVNKHKNIVRYLFEQGAKIEHLNESIQKKIIHIVQGLKKAPDDMVFRNSTECPISLIDFTDETEKVGCATCKNVFEKDALERWLEYNTTCPLRCGSNLFYLV